MNPQFELTEIGPCEKQVQVTIPPEDVRAALDNSYRMLRTQVALPGFRAGKVPRNILERRFGDHVKHEVAHDLIQEAVEAAVKEHEFELVSEPELDEETKGHDHGEISAEESFSFGFKVELKPEFDLPKYRGVEVVRRRQPVTEEQIKEVLDRTAEGRAQWVPAEREEFEAGDQLTGLFSAVSGEAQIVEDEPFSFEPSLDEVVAPEGLTLENTLEALQGKKVGDAVSMEITVPAYFKTEELRGATATASFEIDAVKRRDVPAVDDAFAKDLGFEDLAGFEKDAREKLEAEHDRLADREVVQSILKTMVEEADIPLAQGAVDRTLEERMRRLQLELRIYQGLDGDAADKAVEERRDEVRQSIEFDTRAWYLVEKIAKKEKIFCLEDDVDEAFRRMAEEHGATPAQVREHYEKKDMMSGLRAEVVEQKVCEFLREQAKITEEEGNAGADAAEADASE